MRRFGAAVLICLSLGLTTLFPGFGIAAGPDEARLQRIYDEALAKAGKSFLKPPGLNEAQKKRILEDLNEALDQAARAPSSKPEASGPNAGESDEERQRRLEELKKKLLAEAKALIERAVTIGACAASAEGELKEHVVEIKTVAAELHVGDVEERYETYCLTAGKGTPEQAAAMKLALQRGVGEEGRGRFSAAGQAADRLAGNLGATRPPEFASALQASDQRPSGPLLGTDQGSPAIPQYQVAERGLSGRIPGQNYGSLKLRPVPDMTPAQIAAHNNPGKLATPPAEKHGWYTRQYADNAAQESLNKEAEDRFKRMNKDLSLLGKITHTVSALDNRASAVLWQERAKGDLSSPKALGAMAAKVLLAVPSKVVSIAKLLTATEEGNLGGAHVAEAALALAPIPGSEKLGPMFVRSGAGRALFRGASNAVSQNISKEARIAMVNVVARSARSGAEMEGKELYNTLEQFVRGESG